MSKCQVIILGHQIQIDVCPFLIGHLSVFRDTVEEEAFSSLFKVLSRLCDELQSATGDDGDLQSSALQLQLTAECFRAQRNACVQSTRNQCLLRYFLIQSSPQKIVGNNKKIQT